MQLPNRGWRDIIADVLEVSKTPTTKTMIMFKAVLSYDLLKEYLKMIQDAGLLEHDATTGKYFTTKKGLDYLQTYDVLNSFVQKNGMRSVLQIEPTKRSYIN